MKKSPVLLAALLLSAALWLPACKRKEAPKPQEIPTPVPVDTSKSVVKVFSTIQNVDFYEPWKPGSTASQEGCGTLLPGGKILVNALLANKANYIEVQKFGETKRYAASVETIGWDMDLALLKVDDKDFLAGTIPVEFGTLPQPGDKVILQGGDELSKKEETLSALDMVFCYSGLTYIPAFMTNNEIELKIRGCPVFKDGKFIGIPFDSWHKKEKSGSIIPVNVIQRFLRAVEGGKTYEGLTDAGVYCQGLESPELRDYYHLPADKTGVVVTSVLWSGASEGLLKEGDVITAIDGHTVDNEGYIQLDKAERVICDYLITFYLPGETTEIEVYRAGQGMKIKVPLKPEPKLIPYRSDNRKPTYFMTAGFVFVPMTGNYVNAVDWKNIKPELKELYLHGVPSPEHRQIVLLSHVLPADINRGYHYFSNIVVDKVNGMKINGMKDLVAAFEKPRKGFHVIEFDDHAWNGSIVVFDAGKTKKATQEIMKNLSISADRSDDLR